MQIFREIPFIKPKTEKWLKTMKNERKRLVLVEFLQLVRCLEDSVRLNLFVF